MGRIIERVKYADARVELSYTETNETSVNSYTIDSAEQPLRSFIDALQELKSHVLDLLELPDEYGKGITVTTVSFTYKSDVMGAVVSAQKKISGSNAPFNINTPSLPEKPYNPKDTDSPHLTPLFVKALQRVIAEAGKYIEGKRLQIEASLN